jgi:hypothetical protein
MRRGETFESKLKTINTQKKSKVKTKTKERKRKERANNNIVLPELR